MKILDISDYKINNIDKLIGFINGRLTQRMLDNFDNMFDTILVNKKQRVEIDKILKPENNKLDNLYISNKHKIGKFGTILLKTK